VRPRTSHRIVSFSISIFLRFFLVLLLLAKHHVLFPYFLSFHFFAMKFLSTAGAVLLPFATFVSAIDFNAEDEASIKAATKQYAYGLMSYYKANATDLPKEKIGIFPDPHYWWEAGAAWGAMIEYSQFTDDQTYVKTLQQALVANYGPNNDIILPWKKAQEVCAFTCMQHEHVR
jgi:hypothetical protein